MRVTKPVLAAIAALVFFGTTPVHAQGGAGVQAGLSLNPDQFYFGGQYEFGPVTDQIWFRPNANLGFGNQVTLFSANLELVYFIPQKKLNLKDWRVYVGAGPAINFYSFDNGGNPAIDNSDVRPGLNFVGGFQNRKGLFFEFKAEVLDSPDVRFGVGYTFPKR